MKVSRSFYRVAAICSLLSAATTLMLILLPYLYYPVAEGLPGRMERVTDPLYQLRAWTYALHPFLVFTAALGVAAASRRAAPALALGGLLGFALWAATEAAQQCLTLFAFDAWRRAWLLGDPAVRATIELRTAFYDGLWNAAYALLLIGFIIGNSFLAACVSRFPDRLSRILAGFFGAAVLLSLSNLSGEMGGPAFPASFAELAYPAIQPLARLLIGFWLFRIALQGEPPTGSRAA